MSGKKFLVTLSSKELSDWAVSRHFPAYRARQIYGHIFEHLLAGPEQMNNIPKDVKAALAEDFYAPSSRVEEIIPSGQGVEKLRLSLFDGDCVEVAVIPALERVTLCLSTQVGCPVGCRFCASGAAGFVRNLTAGEIIEEFLAGCARVGRKCDNIVFMGIGEGLLNADNLFAALMILTERFGMSPRRITVSTSGYVPGILRFAQLGREYNLAISLHAPDDETRAKLIPDHVRYPIDEILAAAETWREKSGRIYTLEYTVIAGINDSPLQGKALGRLAFAHHAKINLIPYNPTQSGYSRPAPEAIENFEKAILSTGAMVTRRVERGRGGSAACGQLRANSIRR